MAIVLNPGKQQDEFRGEMFCWNELPELLLVDDLFDSQKDHLRPIPTIIAEDDEDEDEDWDDDEEYEDEEYEDEDEGEEFEEGDDESDDESDDEDEYEDEDDRRRR